MKLIINLLLLVSFASFGQELSEHDLLKSAKEIMLKGSCTLITIDENGIARARAMDPFLPAEDFVVWFGTKSKSRKVEQIKNNPMVTLYYLDEDGSGYVTIFGKATLISDCESKMEKWKNAWADFYAEDKSDYLLIKAEPIWLEILSPKRGINNNPATWVPPKVEFRD